MDKQTSTIVSSLHPIPVNTRTIGTPEGIYIIYLEDYVHTFIKKLLLVKASKEQAIETQELCQVENSDKPDIALYGNCIEDHGRYRLVVSGAAQIGNEGESIPQINEIYFPGYVYIATARLSRNKDLELRMELTFNSTRVIVDDFYIYYDQNEQMQNYLIEWTSRKANKKSNKSGGIASTSIENERSSIRGGTDDAARIGRLMQAYGREEAKVSFMWNMLNVLCLGFVVCVMAYGIISINNYSKMQNMQTSIDYCLSLLAERTDQETEKSQDQRQAVATMQQNQTSNTEKTATEIEQEMVSAPQTTDEPPIQNNTASSQVPVSDNLSSNVEQDLQNAVTQENLQSAVIQENQGQSTAGEQEPTQEIQPSTTDTQASNMQTDKVPQYYVVRQGDTLRTISFAAYGDFDHVDAICQWNHIDDPNNILSGQKLLLP